MTRTRRHFALAAIAAMWILVTGGKVVEASGRGDRRTDTTVKPVTDTLRYPLEDRRGDPFTVTRKNPFDLKSPKNLKDSIAYDPARKVYYIYEKIGDTYYRRPTYYTFDELNKILNDQAEKDYFQQRANALSLLNHSVQDPGLTVHDNFFNRIFSNSGLPKVDIKPQGYIAVQAGYQGQKINNPTLPENARSTGGFDFNMNASVNVNANIGDKLKLPFSYNTQSTFDFQNQFKLEYTGNDDDIIKKIEAGNINFTTKSTLMPGVQSLFGIKTQLQFGKLYVTAALANQKSSSQHSTLQGGSAVQSFKIKSDEYEENKHFLLAQYFRNHYNKVMANVPVVTTPVEILRMEVWVTNRQGTTTNNRTVVGLMDLGETTPYSSSIHSMTSSELPFNSANDEYQMVTGNTSFRDPSLVTSQLQAIGLKPTQDYEKTYARKLASTDYYFNPKVGFLSINQTLQSDDVLGVAYQYTYNGKTYQVGEFSSDVTPDTTASNSGSSKVLFLKLLKATAARPALPIWKLMMKNVYSVGYGTLTQTDFNLNVLYSEPGGGLKRYVPFGDASKKGTPLLTVLNLDRLNNQNDPQPDGVFDFVDGYTVLSQYSKVVFPLLEPFGRDLASSIYTNVPANASDTLFYILYDSLKWVAQQSPQLNRYVLQGSYKGSSSSSGEISLNAYNIPQGSVTVTAGSQTLVENTDYIIDYSAGTVRIINQAILNSGVAVNVNFENSGTYGQQQKNFMGLRLDYIAKNKPNEQLSFGATLMRLSERPYFSKVSYGEDPIKNTMFGGDFNYQANAPRLTKWLDKLPFYSTTAASSITASGEIAKLIPGHPSQIGSGSEGQIYLDDFEGTKSGQDLRFPFTSWAMSSTPAASPDPNGTIMFPEATLGDNLSYGKNRARIAWYNIETVLQDAKSTNNPLKGNLDALSDPRVRPVSNLELFPEKTNDIGQNQLITFDMAYYPKDRGAYNFDNASGSIDRNGQLLNPKQRWGGIMRSLDQTDFETSNVEFIEFWIQDPYIQNPTSSGGRLYFNLGNLSEDILKDGKRFYENGLSTPNSPAPEDTSVWGKIPKNAIQITNAFSSDASERPYQDVGLDGLTDTAEARVQAGYLSGLQGNVSSDAYQKASNDPSNDNYMHYRNAVYDNEKAGILTRYKLYNNPQGNSPVSGNTSYSSASTLYPDNEDLNKDNTLNESEEYFQYHVDLKAPTDPTMQTGQNYIADKRTVSVKLLNGQTRDENWYLFRIPIKSYETKVGSISDFKSIRFMRMFMTNFEDSAVLRFAKLELVRNQWRTFSYQLDTTGQYKPIENTTVTTFNVTAVNIEENDQRYPIPYRMPPGVERQQQLSSNNVSILQNEQSMSLQLDNLQDGDARSVYKTLTLDLRRYRRMQMFMHAEAKVGYTLKDNELTAVIRMGDDFVSNFYEIRIPLKVTAFGATVDTDIWPTANNLDLMLNDLVQLKMRRTGSVTTLYSETQSSGVIYSVMGSPNLGQLGGMLIGIENGKNISGAVNAEVWIDELRLSQIDEKGGYAATGRVNVNLADLGTVNLSGSIQTAGWGSIEQNTNERSFSTTTQLDVATNLELGKLLPKKLGLSIPFYGSFSQTISTPEYDPYDQDVLLSDEMKGLSKSAKDSIKNYAIDYLSVTTINFTNVRKIRNSRRAPRPWDLANFDISFSYTSNKHHSPTLQEDNLKKYYGGLGYTFNGQEKFWRPFKKITGKSKTHWFDLIKDFNFNPIPSLLLFRTDFNRQFGISRAREVQVKGVAADNYVIPATYNKYFTINRTYGITWQFTKSFNMNIQATTNARVDEPDGELDTKEKRDSLWKNIWKGGRNVLYKQTATFTYTLPTAKLPAIDWINANISYVAGYNWIGASRLQDQLGIDLGNTIENTSQRVASTKFDFTRLYNKFGFFRQLDKTKAPPPQNNQQSAVRDTSKAGRGRASATPKPTLPTYVNSGFVRFLGGLVSSLKAVGIDYSENFYTRLPGFTDSAVAFGRDWKSGAPSLGFMLGQQPNSAWLDELARKGWITKDTAFNDMFTQTFQQELKVNAQLMPLHDLTIDLSLTKSFNKNYTELFKDTTGTGQNFGHLSPYASGGFNISFIALKTIFSKFNPNITSETFLTFQNYRSTVSKRLGNINPYSSLTSGATYATGYGQYSQDVLVPAFIAAYSGRDPNKVALLGQTNQNIRSNPFSGLFPMPNWRITYSGLSKIPALSRIFSSFTLGHAYTGNLSMNNFTSSLDFMDPNRYGWPGFIDTVSHNFVPYFVVPNVTITENFSPFLSVDMTFTNQLNLHIEYLKGRTVSLSLVDYQVSESRSSGISIGAGWRKKGLMLPFKVPFSKKDTKKLDNDLNMRLDLSIRDNKTANTILDQNYTTPVAGNKVITIQPSIDYVLNARINVKLYFDQTRVLPYISSSPPTINTKAGVEVRISLQ